MNTKISRASTLVFAGTHRTLIAAHNTKINVFEAEKNTTTSADPEAELVLEGIPDAEPVVTTLSSGDFSTFLEAIEEEKPNDALLRAVARRAADAH